MSDNHLEYIEKYLIPELVAKFEDETLIQARSEHAGGLDGFMSALYILYITTKRKDSSTRDRTFFAKFMKGDVNFRESSKSYILFANEIHTYANVLSAYKELLQKHQVNSFAVTDLVPEAYIAKFGYIEGLSSSPKSREAVLVVANLKPLGYGLGPRVYLHLDQLLCMCRCIGKYHALSYALKLTNSTEFSRLKNGLTTLHFINDNDPDDAKTNVFRVLYRVAFDRFYEFFDRKIDSITFDKKSDEDLRLIEALRTLRVKYFAEPTRLLEKIRTNIEKSEEDNVWGAILHGDFNRNNVLFLNGDGRDEKTIAIKMIDFQEARYGTPAIDLSFFMYMNTQKSLREEHWMSFLMEYHKSLYSTLTDILKSSSDVMDEDALANKLEPYSFEKFKTHFSRYAFYGVMVCMHFLPWLQNEEECEQLSNLFESDMHGEEFRKISMEAGGDDVNFQILDIIRHACKMGYIDDI